MLIDADNARRAAIRPMLVEIATYGSANIRRAYGDWTGSQLSAWRDELLGGSIRPVQQFAYTTGKNATDSAMIIDAMDLLHAGGLDGICLVSSDSDFTRLAQRFREAGLRVYGFGEQKTPMAFVAACHRFVHVENLLAESAASPAVARPAVRGGPSRSTSSMNSTSGGGAAPSRRHKPAELRADAGLMALLRAAVGAASDDNGLAHLARVGDIIGNRDPAFDTRAWGHTKLVDLVAATEVFEIERRSPGPGKPAVVYVRDPDTPHT